MSPSKGQESSSTVLPCAAFFLVGPTAAGKSAIAQHIAEIQKRDILSADSMLVYRGMDIGTAKPSPDERARVAYGGLDLANPDEPFNVGQYVEHAQGFLRASCAKGLQPIVTGGTGLYVKCLTQGLARLPPADPALRAWAEALLERDGIEALQKALQERDMARYEALRDKNNPRRLIRALELAGREPDESRTWSPTPAVPMIGLNVDPSVLAVRIQTRVRGMYDSGLLDEVDRLLSSYAKLSETAAQAIGYAEAIAVRQGHMTLADAMTRTAVRTRQLAKRQMTWFRHQANVIWISVAENSTIEQIARQVLAQWKQYGPTPVIS
jgi:tRNA dimethylallyltransferase